MRRKLLLLLLLAGLTTASAGAHGGEDHGPAPATTPAGAAYFTAVATSAQFEVLLRYSPLRPGEAADLRLFLSDFATNVPVSGARLLFTAPDDPTLKFKTMEKGPGEYLIETTFPARRVYSLTVQVATGDKADLLLLEGIAVGQALPIAAAPGGAPSWLTWQTGLLLLGTFLLGGVAARLLQRRGRPAAIPQTPAH